MGRTAVISVMFLCSVPQAAHAGVFTDDLSRCLVEKTTDADRATLIRWMFAALTLNPKLADLVSAKSINRDEINELAAALFIRLVTKDCASQTDIAVRAEGPAAIQGAFAVLGQSAGIAMMTDPAVVAGLSTLTDKFAPALSATLGKKP